MTENIFTQFSSEKVDEVEEKVSPATTTPTEDEKTNSQIFEFTEAQDVILKNLAIQKETDEEKIRSKFDEIASTPFFAKMGSTEQAFRMIKGLVTNEFDKLSKLSGNEIYVIGRNINYIEKLKHTMTKLIIIARNKDGEAEIQEVSAWEPLGDKAYATILDLKNGYNYTANLVKGQNDRLRLQSNSTFNAESHPIDLDDQFEDMNDSEILADMLKMQIFDSIEEAGMSDVVEQKGKFYPDNKDLKIIRVVLTKPYGIFKNKDIPDLYTLIFKGTDREGNSIDVRITSTKEFKLYETTTENYLPATVIGTVSEYNEQKQINAFNIVFDEY